MIYLMILLTISYSIGVLVAINKAFEAKRDYITLQEQFIKHIEYDLEFEKIAMMRFEEQGGAE